MFSRNQIDVLPLKGALLSQRLFGEPGLRDVRDVDLLVRPGDLERAGEQLREAGYDRTFPDFALTPRMRRSLLEREWHFTYRRRESAIEVELHWRFDLWRQSGVDELWENSRPVNWMGAAIRELSSAALLLLLCDHGARHKWFCLKWLADVAVMIAALDESAAAQVVATGVRMDLERPLAQAAELVRRVYGIPIAGPLDLLVRREVPTMALADGAMRAMLGGEAAYFAGESGRGWFGSRRYGTLLRKRGSLPRTLLNQFVRVADFGEVALPDRLFWLYYILRPALWLRRLGVSE